MDVKFDIDARAVLAAARASPRTTVDEMRRGLLEACRLIQSESRAKHRFRSKTGMLEKSVSYQVDIGKVEGVIELSPSVASYGHWVHTGTRPHDISPKNKRALRWATFIGINKGISAEAYKKMRMTSGYNYETGKDSRFRRGTEFAFAKHVHHPGTKPDEFLYEAAARSRMEINAIFGRHTQEALRKAGLT